MTFYIAQLRFSKKIFESRSSSRVLLIDIRCNKFDYKANFIIVTVPRHNVVS